MKKVLRLTPLSIAILTSGPLTIGAHAQSSARSELPLLEEVVVTAQRRAENLQEVPIAISAFTADGLKKAGIRSSDELSIVTPGLQMGRQIGSSTPFLRGVGTTNTSAGDESSIATYVDGIYSPAMSANVYNLNSIERIEVLKGPQGTLFGRNATGGLVHIITRDPEQEFSGKIEGSYGSYDTLSSRFYMTGGLNERTAADVALLFEEQGEGFGTNRFNGDDIGKSESRAIRSKLLFDASDNTSLRLTFDYSKSSSDIAIAAQPAPGALGIDGALIYQGCTAGPDQTPGTSDDGDPASCAAAAQAGATKYTGEWHDINADTNSFYDTRKRGFSVRLDHSFETMDLVSLTGYQESNTYQLLDQDATPVNLVNVVLADFSETITQEFHLLSNSDSRLEWMLGLFLMDASAGYEPLSISGLGTSQQIPGAQMIRNTPSQDTQSISPFAQASYDFSATTSLTIGARLTKDTREGHAKTTADFGNGYVTLDEGSVKESWTELTWRIALDHQLTDSTLLFGSLSRGFKSGVYNLVALSSASTPVDPETLDAIEVGIKADLLDDHLRLNASVYQYRYEDLQVQRVVGGSSQLVNAAESEISGMEADATYALDARLSLSAGISLIDAEFKHFPDAPSNTPTGIGGNSVSSTDAQGNKVLRTPDLTYNLGINYMIPTENGRYSANLHYYYNDGFYWDQENRLEQESYSIVNAELGWESLTGGWEAKVYGKNLLDEEYSYFSYSSALGDNVTAAAPSTLGVAVTYHF